LTLLQPCQEAPVQGLGVRQEEHSQAV